MKLSDLRPCDACRDPLGLSFNVVRHSGALAGGSATRQVAGLTAITGSLVVAEALAPSADQAVIVFGDEDKQLQNELFLCNDCFASRLADLVERRSEDIEAQP